MNADYELDFERAVTAFYEGLYRFAFGLAGNEDDACALTQEAFARFLTRGGPVGSHSELKSRLFTTLYRVFDGWKSRESGLPELEISGVERDLPPITPESVDALDHRTVREALLAIGEAYRVPLMLYYQEHSFDEIARLLEIPIGTVMSRLSTAKALMRESLSAKFVGEQRPVVPLAQTSMAEKRGVRHAV